MCVCGGEGGRRRERSSQVEWRLDVGKRQDIMYSLGRHANEVNEIGKVKSTAKGRQTDKESQTRKC